MNDRQQQVQDIVDVYTNKFTCAQFCDRLADVERYSKEANNWFLAQRSANNITAAEVEAALGVLSDIAVQKGIPFLFDNEVVK